VEVFSMLIRPARAALVASALAASLPVAAQQLDGTARPEILNRQSQVLDDSGATSRRLGDSPLNPLDAPDAGNVWKPSNRDAGNLGAERWAAYAARRREASATAGAEPQSPKPAPWNRYPHYDSFAEFFQSVFR
jgi:hypothetical protein